MCPSRYQFIDWNLNICPRHEIEELLAKFSIWSANNLSPYGPARIPDQATSPMPLQDLGNSIRLASDALLRLIVEGPVEGADIEIDTQVRLS